MPFDGNGQFELAIDFTVDRDGGFPSNRILAQRMMIQLEDMATGLEESAAESYARLTGTSTSSVAIATGSKSFTTQANKAFAVGRWVLIASDANAANYMHGRVTAYSGTSLTVLVTNIGGSGTLADWTITLSGTQGATGTTGATGGPAETFLFATSTVDSDPGSGNFRLNHATPASATAAYVDNNNASGSDVSAWLDTFDDAGKSADRGVLHMYVRASPGTNFRVYRVTGSVTDGTGYRKLVIAHINGAGAFTAADVLDVKFIPRGADGADGVGSGDVVGPAGANDGDFAQFDGTSGELLKGGLALDADGSLAANSDTRVPSQRAVKAYADALIAANVVGPAGGVSDSEVAIYNSTTGRLIKASGVLLATLTAKIANLVEDTTPQLGGEFDLNAHGVSQTAANDGTKSTGTYTPTHAGGGMKRIVNGGAFTLAPPSGDGTLLIDITNNGSAGAITTSGFTKKTGDSFTTTDAHKFRCFISMLNTASHLHVQAMQ